MGKRSVFFRVIIPSLLIFSVLFCAKKMLPPSPDRFPPRLLEATSRSRAQVELLFDEEIDPRRLAPESLVIVGGEIRGISMGKTQSRILVWTQPQKSQNYEIKGAVWDIAGNRGRFHINFVGSSRIDTIVPRTVEIEPAPGSANLNRGIRIRVRFSEPIDTALPLDFVIIPRKLETTFSRSWSPDWQELRFIHRDSITSGQNCYFLLFSGIKDLEGNSSIAPVWTYFTSDSVFDAVRVRGRCSVTKGVVFWNQEQTEAVVPILADGSFELKIRPGRYLVFGVGDTNQDGLVDLKSEEVEFNTSAESLRLLFGAESLPRRINEYCR